MVEGGDGAAGDDAEVWGEGGDGDEAKVGSAFEQVAGAVGGCGEVEVVAGGEGGLEGRVVEVPHERGGVQEVDGGYAEGHRVEFRGQQQIPFGSDKQEVRECKGSGGK